MAIIIMYILLLYIYSNYYIISKVFCIFLIKSIKSQIYLKAISGNLFSTIKQQTTKKESYYKIHMLSKGSVSFWISKKCVIIKCKTQFHTFNTICIFSTAYTLLLYGRSAHHYILNAVLFIIFNGIIIYHTTIINIIIINIVF